MRKKGRKQVLCSWCQAVVTEGVCKVAKVAGKYHQVVFCDEQEAAWWARSLGERFEGWPKGLGLSAVLLAVAIGLALAIYVNHF